MQTANIDEMVYGIDRCEAQLINDAWLELDITTMLGIRVLIDAKDGVSQQLMGFVLDTNP